MNTTAMQAHGGDLIETSDGQQGRIKSSSFSLLGHETYYTLDTGLDVFESEIAKIIEHGRHDYRTGEKRGFCGRCGVAKKQHS